MAQVRNVEKRIYEIEGFGVAIRNMNGRRLSATGDLPMYAFYEKMAPNKWTVQKWKNDRFLCNYPGCQVDVFNGKGRKAIGQTTLATLRDTYLEE